MIHYVQQFNIFSSEDLAALEGYLVDRHLGKGDFFIETGAICREIAFIESGSLRSFYHSPNGDEVTTCVRFSNGFKTSFSSLIQQRPSQYAIQAIAPTTLHILHYDRLQTLVASNPRWQAFYTLMAEQQAVELEDRNFFLHTQSAQEKYAYLLQKHPQYLQEVPLKYLASYLGMTTRHLSRIRKQLRER